MYYRIYNRVYSAARLFLLVCVYALISFLSLLFCLFLRFDFQVAPEFWHRFWQTLVWLVPLKIGMLSVFGQFQTLLSYFSLPDAKRIAFAMLLSGFVGVVVWFADGGTNVVPRGVLIADTIVSFSVLATFRTVLRTYRETLFSAGDAHAATKKRRVAIVGAGSAGAALAQDILSRPGLGLNIVCFLDDDRRKIGGMLHGRPIFGPTRKLKFFAQELELQKIIIALPTAKSALIKKLVEEVNETGLDHDILPSVPQLLGREVTVSRLRHIDPEDLLGRDIVNIDEDGISSLLKKRTVMVTGAGGSIGSELCRQIATQNPGKILLVERSEPALFAIEQELLGAYPHVPLVARASSVCDERAIERIISNYRPDIIFHAAAHKHVPLMESQPEEAVRNNALGTEIVARLCANHGTAKFVLVSSDKAVNPTNVMGATKRLAEMIVGGYQTRYPQCCFSSVRFGNVIGSSGSVIPIFRQQISKGGPVTVTHPDATRYFMSLSEAVGLILQSALQADAGEIFVLEMGRPIKILDLARQMIELSGFTPEEDIKISYVGLRPGEKLYEEPIHEMENVEKTTHPKIYRLLSERRNGSDNLAQDLADVLANGVGDSDELRSWLTSKVPEYRPNQSS